MFNCIYKWKNSPFLLLLPPLLPSPAAVGVTEAVTASTASSVVQHVHSRPALCFMRYSWHTQPSACDACLWKYLSGDLCLYWMQLCLQFCPRDIDLAMLPKHIQAFNLFWSTQGAQESGLPYIALSLRPWYLGFFGALFFQCRCKAFVWTYIDTGSQVNTRSVKAALLWA